MTAFDHWTAMHAWWVARRTERDGIGRAWPPKAAKDESGTGNTASTGLASKPPTAQVTADAASPSPTPTLKFAKERMTQDRMRDIARNVTITTQPPDEGGEVLSSDVAALAGRFDKLSEPAKNWFKTLVAAGMTSHPWHIKGHQTVRRYELYRGVLALAQAEYCDDDYIKAIVAAITNTYHPDKAAGAALGELGYAEAADFATVAHDLITEKYLIIHGDDDRPRIQAVA